MLAHISVLPSDGWRRKRSPVIGDMEEHWEEYMESYLVDINLHKYQCTKCKQVLTTRLEVSNE